MELDTTSVWLPALAGIDDARQNMPLFCLHGPCFLWAFGAIMCRDQ
jgi:hypothetical protein